MRPKRVGVCTERVLFVGISSCAAVQRVYNGAMSSHPTLSLPSRALFTKPTKQGWLTFGVALACFCVALGLLAALFSLPTQTTIAMLVGGLSVGLSDLLGASAKRVGTMQHVLCVAGFYCGAWLAMFVFDVLFFGHTVMPWMGW